ncbi:MAG: hypothetical protein NTV22_14205 [bacterium]|nr:hypothetical protein [bacterium]
MNVLHLLCVTGALLLAGLLYAETSADTTPGTAAGSLAGSVQNPPPNREVPQTPEEALRIKAKVAEEVKRADEKVAAEARKNEERDLEKARLAAEKAVEHRAKADAYRVTGHPIAEAGEHERQAQQRAAESADKAKARIARDEKNVAEAAAKNAAAVAAAAELAAEQAAQQEKDKREQAVPPGLATKNPGEVKEADKGAQQGQAPVAKRKKWYKLWLSE